MEAFSAYLPVDRRQALARGQTLPQEAHGAVLIADVSSFTSLTETLVARFGRQAGAEELSHLLNDVYRLLTAEVVRYHGSVISSAGDALISWFEGNEKEAARQAVTAAFTMRTTLSPIATISIPDGEKINLAIKSAVATGSARRFLVGDPEMQVFEVLAGSLLDQLGQALHTAHRGEIVVTAETAAALKDDILIVEQRPSLAGVSIGVLGKLNRASEPQPWPPISPLEKEQSEPWLHPFIFEYINSGQEMFMATLRPAVPLFMNFKGIDYDHDPEAPGKLDAFFRWVQKHVARYDGTLVAITTGDKGSYLHISVGTPYAHEDDPQRATALAQALLALPPALNFIQAVQIGISRGLIWSGPIGGPEWRTFVAIGNEVNLAARLMETAQSGHILVSEPIAEATAGTHQWQFLQEISVKGITKPFKVYDASMTTYLDILTSYLPVVLRRQLSADPTPLNAPRAETFPAAFLFGDITGFTPLTVRLAQKGTEGVEELSRLLHGYFDKLISLIVAHGGDILKIAGDGVQVVWPCRDEPMGATVLRAAQCALAIQAELHNYEIFAGAKLAMRIGLSAGPLTLAQLGGIFGRWEALPTGSPILEAGLAEKNCQPGQVMIAPEAWALAYNSLPVEMVGKDGKQLLRLLEVHQPPDPLPTPLLPLASEAETAARAYIPGAILQRLAARQTGFLSELRHLTVIFVNLPDFERISDLNDAQIVTQTLQRALYRYEGSVNQFIMDEKGVSLVAALGLPPFAHQDDPARGLLAALEMAAGQRALQQRYAIGVTSGLVYCGERGNRYRREYALLGDAVNTAARLMQAVLKTSASDIFCDSATRQAANSRLDFEPLMPVMVKGKVEPIPVYRPLQEKSATLRDQAELIGREVEKELLAHAVQLLLRRELQGPIIIEGEAGMGKTRLIEDLKRQAEAAGLAFFSGLGDAIERTTAYHVWRNVFRQWFGLLPGDSLKEQRAKVEAALPEHWRAYAPLLDSTLPLNFAETELTSALTPQARRDKTLDLMNVLLLGLFSRAPTVLVLEDAHWFDTASWTTLTAASQLGRKLPMLLVLTARPLPEPYPPEYVRLLEEPGCRPLRLRPLEEAQTAAFIQQRLKMARVGVALKEFIQKRAEGNPFFAKEILLSLREAGALVETSNGYDLKPGIIQENIDLPDTIQGLIANRIDRLNPLEQVTLKIASVLGRVFDAEMLHAVHPTSEDAAVISQTLSSLQKRDFITPLERGSYMFNHALIRAAIYQQMLFADRRQIHRAVAEWVEQTYADDLEPHCALLAYHWRHTLGDPQEDAALLPKALDYLEKAGQQAAAQLIYQESAEFFSRALNLADKLPTALEQLAPQLRKVRWLTALGIAQENQGQTSKAIQTLEQALRLAGHPMPETKTGLSVGLARELIVQVWHRLRPAFLIPRLPAEREQLDYALAAAQAWLILPYVYNGQFAHSLLTTLRGVNVSEDLSAPPPTLSFFYSELNFFTSLAGSNPVESLYARLAKNTPLSTSEPTLQSGTNYVSAGRFIGQGQWELAKFHTEQALALLERQPTAYRARGNVSNTLAYVYYYQGRYTDHQELAEAAAQLGRMSNNLEFQAYGLMCRAMAHSLMGDFQALQDDLMGWESLSDQSDIARIHNSCYRTRLALALHDWQGAQASAEQLEQMLSGMSFDFFFFLDIRSTCAEAPLTFWERAAQNTDPQNIRRWRATGERACRALWKFSHLNPIGKSAAFRYQGYYDWLTGNPTRAKRNWQSALQAARQFAMRHEEALAHWALARLPGPEQANHREAARQILEGLGAGAYFDYLENLLQ
jgi:class 3 adenylate cyclase